MRRAKPAVDRRAVRKALKATAVARNEGRKDALQRSESDLSGSRASIEFVRVRLAKKAAFLLHQ
jgi:hypothetical protein